MLNQEIIGRNIKALREHFCLNQITLAEFLGTSREMVSYYETGSREVPIRVLDKLADLFGVELADLLEEDPEKALANVALAFRADDLTSEDLEALKDFRKIVKNHMMMRSKVETHGKSRP